MLDQVLPPLDHEMATPIFVELERHGVVMHLKTCAAGFHTVGDKLAVDTGQGSAINEVVRRCFALVRCRYPALKDFVVMAIGVRPDSELACACELQLTARGYIVVDEHQRTSDPAIFAAGDVIQTKDYLTGAPTVCPLAGLH